MTDLFPATYISVSGALDLIGRRLFPDEWTGKEIDARRLPTSRLAEEAKEAIERDPAAREGIAGNITATARQIRHWPIPYSKKYEDERKSYSRHQQACFELTKGLCYGYITAWMSNDQRNRIDIPQDFWRGPLITVGAFLDADMRQTWGMQSNSCRLAWVIPKTKSQSELLALMREVNADDCSPYTDLSYRLFINKLDLEEVLKANQAGSAASEKQSSAGPTNQALAKGGSSRTFNPALQEAINRVQYDLAKRGEKLTHKSFKDWINENVRHPNTPDEIRYSFDPPIPDCDDLYIDGHKLVWKNHEGREKDITIRSLQRYFKRANAP